MRKIRFTTLLLITLCVNLSLRAQIPADGLIGYWPFNGNAIDESANSVEYYVVGAVLTEDKDANTNSAYVFDGVNDYITIGNCPDYYEIQSISFWFCPSYDIDETHNQQAGLICGSSMESNPIGYQIWIYGGSDPQHVNNGRIIISDFTSSSSIKEIKSNTNSWNANIWYHIVVVLDGSGKVYVNGVDDTYSSTLTNSYFSNKAVNLPKYFGVHFWESTMSYFNGALDEIAFYNNALNELEIAELSGNNPVVKDGFWTQAITDLYYLDGNVGIGTDKPTAPLEIKNTGNVLKFSNEGDVTWAFDQVDSISQSDGAGLGLYSEYRNRYLLTFDAFGLVGVNTTNPNANLDVKGFPTLNSFNMPTLRVRSGDGTGSAIISLETLKDSPTYFVFKNNGESRVWLSSRNSTENYAFRIYTNPDGTGEPEKLAMNIEQNGNIGIGTNIANTKLEVLAGSSNTEIARFAGTVSARGLQLSSFLVGGTNEVGFDFNAPGAGGSAAISFSTFGAEAMRIIQGGNVGIGTTNPRALLDVSKLQTNTLSSVLARLPEGNDQGDGTYLGIKSYYTQGIDPYQIKSFAIEHKFYGETNSSINFYRGGGILGGFLTFNTSNNVEQMRITPEGKVGIGTTETFGYKLAVNGTIGAKEVIVETTSPWPDFVFEPDYNLMSLKELEKFIKTNKHLPEIPTTAEVKEKGISVGEMNAKLLEKIEELTLYIIQLEIRVENLENK